MPPSSTSRRPDLQTQDAAVAEMDRQAAEQDFIAQQQQENNRMQQAQEEAAREAARAQKTALANAKRQGVKVAPDATGAETIQRHPDGAAVYEAGFVGEPQINDKGGAVAYRDARGQRYDVPFDAIRSEPDPTGETFYSFDVNGPDGTKQTMRQPAGTKPLFRVDPGTGSRIVDVTDPATGSVQPRIVGLDPLVANKAAVEKRKNASQLAQNERSGQAEELRLQLAQKNTLLQPVADTLRAAQDAADKLAKEKSTYEQAADGFYAVTTLGDGVEPMRRKVDAPQEIAKADAWVKNRAATEKALLEAKAAHDPAAAEIQTMQERRDALALESLKENRRAQAEVQRMEEAAKRGEPVYQPEWQQRAKDTQKNPRVQTINAVADLEESGDPLAPDVEQAALPETNKMLQKVWSAGFQGEQPASLLETLSAGLAANNPAQAPKDATAALALAAKSLGISDPGRVTVEAREVAGLPYSALSVDGEEFGMLDTANNRLVLLATQGSLRDRGAEIIANASADGVPVYLVSGEQPYNKAELRGMIADGIAAVSSAASQDDATQALATAGLSPDDLRAAVMAGKLSVQDGRMMAEQFHGIKAVNTTRPAVEAEFGKYLAASKTAKADWEAGNKAAVVNRFMDGLAAKSVNGIAVDRLVLEERRRELLGQHVKEGALSKAGGFMKELIMPMVGIAGQAVAYVPQKIAKWTGYETEAGRLSEQQFTEWMDRTGSFVHKMLTRDEVQNSLEELRQWAVNASPGATPPDEIADKIAGLAYDGYHELTDEAAKALDTSRDTFNINRDPMLQAAMQRYLRTADPAAFDQLASLMMMDARDRKTQGEVSAYVENGRVASAGDVMGRAKGLSIDLTPDKATALIGISRILARTDDPKAAQKLIADAGKIMGLEGEEAAETLERVTADETDDPDSAFGLLKGGFVAGRQELATELVTTGAEAGLAWVTAGAATPEIIAERAASQAAKSGIRAAIRRNAQSAFTKLADSSTAFAKTSALLGKARQTVGTGLANMGEAFAKAGIKTPTFGQPLTKLDKVRNAAVQVGKNAAAAAPMEALEEGIAAIGEPDPNAASIGEQMLMGAAGGLVLTPMFAGAAAVGQAWKNRGAGAEWEKRKAGYVEELNRRMESVPGFKPITVADFDAWQGLQDNPAQAQARASYQSALATFEQELALHQDAAAGNATLPELLAARVQLDSAAKELELATSSAFMAMDQLREIPEAERPLYTGAAKAASGARDFTEAEAKALMAQGGNNAIVFQQAQVLPADVAGPPAQRTVGAPAVSTVAPGVYRLPEGVRVDVPPALLDSLVSKAPEMVDLLRQPANQTPAVQAVVAAVDAKTQAMPKAGKTAPATRVQPQQSGGQNMPQPGNVPVVPVQPPAQAPTQGGGDKTVSIDRAVTNKGTTKADVYTAAQASPAEYEAGIRRYSEANPKSPLAPSQRNHINEAIADGQPVNAEAVDTAERPIKLPDGWVKRDGMYHPPQAPTPGTASRVAILARGQPAFADQAELTSGRPLIAIYDATGKETGLVNMADVTDTSGVNLDPRSKTKPAVTPPATGQTLPAKAIEKVTREAIGRIAAKSPRIKALLKESKKPSRVASGGMWLEPDGKVSFHVPTIIQQLESIGVTDNATAGKRVEALLDEEIRHSANMEAARRLFAGEQAAGRVLRGMSFETWRDAWYGDIWNSHFTGAMRQAVQEAYGDTLPEAEWMRAMEGLRMLDQLRATGSITEAVLLALDAILESLREFLDLVTAGGKKVVEAEIMAIREVLAEYGYEGGTVKPDAKKKPAKAKAQKQEMAKPADSAPEMSPPQKRLPILTVSDATSIKVASDPVDLIVRADAKGMVKISQTSFGNAQTGGSQSNITFEFRTVDGMRRVTFRDDGPRDAERVAAEKQPAYRFSPVLDQTSQAIPPKTSSLVEAPETAPEAAPASGLISDEESARLDALTVSNKDRLDKLSGNQLLQLNKELLRQPSSAKRDAILATEHPDDIKAALDVVTKSEADTPSAKFQGKPAKRAEPSREEWQKTYSKFKRALARAVKAKDYAEIIQQADAFQQHYETAGNGGFPDQWSDWERHKADAEMQLARQGDVPLRPLVVPTLKPVTPPRPAANADADYLKAQEDTRAALGGLFSAPVRRSIPQLEVPEERFDAVRTAAKSIIAAKIRTPEAFAKFLDDTFPGGKARPYSEAIWDVMGVWDKSLRGTHDWTRIYGDIDQPLPDVQEPAIDETPSSELGPVTDLDRALVDSIVARDRKIYSKLPDKFWLLYADLIRENLVPTLTTEQKNLLTKINNEEKGWALSIDTAETLAISDVAAIYNYLIGAFNPKTKTFGYMRGETDDFAVSDDLDGDAEITLLRPDDFEDIRFGQNWSSYKGNYITVTAAELQQDDTLAIIYSQFLAIHQAKIAKENNDIAKANDDSDKLDEGPDAIRDLILSPDSRAKKAQAMKKLAEERGETLKQTQEFVESRLVQIADQVAREDWRTPQDRFEELVGIYDKQPLFSARTSTSMENQAYSTPAPMSFALRHMTGVTPQTSVYDATAGNGMLAIGADLTNSVANEIDETRIEGLRRLGIGTITTKDATDPTGAFQNRPKAQTVHLNPPFGGIPNVNFDGYGIRKLEHIISLHALKEGMADNGTAAIILGDTMNNQEQVKGAQWVFENYLYAHYNVVDNFSVSGDLYGNQGAKWPVRILVIAGKKAVPTRNQDLAPKTVDRLDTWPDVWARAERTRNEVERQRQTLGTDGQTTAPSGNPAGNAGTANTRPIPDSQRPDASASSGSGVRGGNAGGQSRPGATGAGGSGLAAPGTTEQPADAGTSVQPGTGGRKPASSVGGRGGRRPSSATNAPSGSSQTSGGTDTSGQNPANAGSVNRPDRQKAAATATQVPYDPASSGMPFETLAPRGIGESLQMALAEIVANRGPIDQYVADQLDMSVADLHKAMAAEQIDGVAMAIYQMETGGALIIGDETGIGKGRQAASLIRFAILKGKIPVFFTKDPKLFSDMWGDLKDIGTTVTGPNASASDMSVRPLILGDSDKAQIRTPENAVVLKPASNARQSTVFAAARENGFASTGHNAIFATYSQIRDPNDRQAFLEWLAENDDVVVVLDEAHESAGDGETSMQAAFMMGGTVKRGKGSSKTEITKSGLLNGPGAMHPRGGVAYLSATFAKRPDNMPVYFRTDLRKGADKFSQVVEAMDKGGVALQQAITEALAEAGQYTRRERDFTGVSYAMKQVTVRDEAELVRQVDAVTNVLSSIANFSKLIRAAVADSTARSDSQSSMTDFASIVHNQVSQLLLAAKADAVVDEVVEAHKRGEKPIVALMNTMGSFLSQYVEAMNIKPGQPMKLNWAALLEYALSRTLRASEKQPNGDTVIYTVDPAEHGLGMAYQRVLSAARGVNVAFPVSPIDYIIQKSRANGVEVGELTGRDAGIDYTDFQTGEGTYRKFKVADKNTLVNTFNNGTLAGMLLNASGSTGLSIHAASKFKDQKPRHMVIAQPALDINVFIQTLGRIKRTGIVLLGRYPDGSAYGARYSHLTLPLNSELRPAIMAARKMKSLNANTTGESDSAVKIEAEDLMNRFGNQVVAEYLSRNPELQDALNIEVEEKEDGTVVANKDIARKFTGRMALQPNKVQGEAYAEIISDYRRAIEQAKVTGDYDLEIIVHEDWDATRGASEQIVAGTDESSIFTSSVNVELWDMTDNRPTPSGADMIAEFTKENGSREQLDARWQDFSRQVDERLDSLEQRLRQRLAEASGQLAGMSPDDPAHKGLEREVASLERNVSGVNVKKARWRDTQRRLDDIVDEAGRPVTLENAETQEMDHGMMTQIKFPDITGQLRIAPSAFKMTYLLNRPGGRIYPTLAQFKQDGYTQARSMYSVEDMTGDRGGRRERRTILVGSPIRAYGATGGKGKVVRFKARDGSLVTGILMPRSWNISNLAEDPRKELADAGAVGKYMRDLGWTPGFAESGDSVRIHAANGSFRISAPSARRTGGDIFLDDQLREIVGDFNKNGQRMTAYIDSAADLERVAARVMQITGKRFKGQDVARVRKANGVDENADMDSPARAAKPKSVVKAAATGAWNSYLDEGGTAANPSVNQISRDQWLNRIDAEEGRSLRSAPVRSTMPRDRAEAIVRNLTGKEQAGKLNPKERAALDEARARLEPGGNVPLQPSSPRNSPPTTHIMPDGYELTGPGMHMLASAPIRAHHGTPHKVDKFSTAKIGTGEGAQAYGWGLYFAESQGVARDYQNRLVANKPDSFAIITLDGVELPRKWSELLDVVTDADERDAIRGIQESGLSYTPTFGSNAKNKKVAAALEKLRGRVAIKQPAGNLYTVELLPDADEFLDWDRPLSEQSEKVKAALASVPLQKYDKSVHKDPRAVDIYSWADSNPYGGGTDSKASAEALLKAGIPGIRFLDGNSRGAGEGTYNYVIFDENLVRILEENGKPVSEAPLASAPVRSSQDAEYLAAVEAGDMATAQRLVDEAAVKGGYTTEGWHGSRSKERFATFDDYWSGSGADLNRNADLGRGFYFTPSRDDALGYARYDEGKLYHVWLRLNQPATEADLTKYGDDLQYEGFDGVMADNGMEYSVFSPEQIKSADPVTRDESGNVIPLSDRFNPQSDSILYSAPAPKPNRATQAMRDIIESLPPPHREVLRDLLVNGMSIEDAATTHGISETAVGNILRRGEAHIRLMMDRNPTKPTVQVQDGVVKATDGRPDLAMSGNAAVAAVDQRRMTPEEVTHAEMQELATRLFDVAPEAENLVVRWMDSGTTVLSTDGMPDAIVAIVAEAQARNAAEMLMTAAAKMLVARKTLEGGNSTQLARLIYLYRNTGTEQARALGMRRDPFDTPEERAAMYLSEALLTPPDAIRNELRRNPANRDRILAAWAKRADEIKAEMLAHGIDLDATFADHAEEQTLIEETIPEPVKPVLARAPKKTRQLVKALLQGMTPSEATKAAGLSAKAAFKAYQDFRASLNQTGTEAAQAMRDQLLRSAPAPSADFAANLGLPDLTEAEWLDAVQTDKPLRTTTETEKLKQHREKAKKAGTLDLKNSVSVRKAVRAVEERKSNAFDKISEFWRASILSGPQTHVVNVVSGLTYGAYEASFKKLAAGVQGDIARMFGAKPDAASLADIPAMIAASLPSIKLAFLDGISAWKSETRAFENYALQLRDDNGELFKEQFSPALKGKLGAVMRGISFRLMGAADEFVKSFFTRIEVAAQARQIARNEGKTGHELAKAIQELMEPGSLAWERALGQAKKITFQTEIGSGSASIDAIDGLAQLISRTKKGDFGKPLKGLAHFTFPFVDTPTNIFKAGVTMSPVGGLLALVDMIRAYNRYRKGNAEEAAKIYNAARALDDLTNQIVAWGFILGLSSLVKPGDDEDETPFITGTIPWRSTSPGERELAYRTAPPQSIRIGDRWISYKRLDPFASALAFTVDAIREWQSGKPIDEVWGKIGLGMLRNMQDKTFLQGVSDVVNAVQDPERFGTKWATNIATGFIPNLIRQPIRAADDVFRETDLPNDLGFWDALGRRMGYGVYPQGAMPAITVWGQPASKDTGTGGPNTDWMLRLLSPADMRAANVDMLDVALLRYNATHQDGDPKALFGVTAPSRELQRTIGGQVVKISLDDAEYEDFITKAGMAARAAIGNTYDGRDLTEQDVERIKDILQRAQGVYRDAAFVAGVQKRGGLNALAK